MTMRMSLVIIVAGLAFSANANLPFAQKNFGRGKICFLICKLVLVPAPRLRGYSHCSSGILPECYKGLAT
jgi:hypothetical protein